ncbi:MAG: hypothetical protein FJ102_09530 [Deltaproteobacteria bacterium]|nr:hypothetical protein [Deltaproteobacteria bacterium]
MAPAEMPGIASAGGSSLQQGAWTHAVPLELPPAPGGMVPSLSLVADHRVPDGWLGPNWSLAGVSRIERHGPLGSGVPSFDLEPAWSADTFLVDGQRLWPAADELASWGVMSPLMAGWAATLWMPEQQDGRVFAYDEVSNTWTASGGGWTWTYGEHVDGGLVGEGATEWRGEGGAMGCTLPGAWALVDTGCPDDTSAWLLSRVQDGNGNRIEYRYDTLPAGVAEPSLATGGGPLAGDFAYAHVLTEVVYGGNEHSAVAIEWSTRPDVLADARGGRARVLPGRVAAIEATAGGELYARYELEYLDEATRGCDEDDTAHAGFDDATTVLKRVYRVGSDDSSRQLRCMETDEALSSWTDDESFTVGEWSEAGSFTEDMEHAYTRGQVVSFDGDPWPDVLAIAMDCDEPPSGTDVPEDCEAPGFRFLRGAPGGLDPDDTAPELALVEGAITEAMLDEGGAHALVDIDADGATDLLLAAPGEYPGGRAMELDPGGAATISAMLDLDSAAARLLRSAQWSDVNGDGLVDLVLPANPLLDDDPDASSLAGYTPGVSHWIPNSGSAPFFSTVDLAPLDIPFEDGAFALLDEAFAECDAAIEGAQPAPPAHYYAEDWQWRATWAHHADFNGDGIGDVAYSVHSCWYDTGELLDPGDDGLRTFELWEGAGLVATIYLGDGSGSFVDTGLDPVGRFDAVALEMECADASEVSMCFSGAGGGGGVGGGSGEMAPWEDCSIYLQSCDVVPVPLEAYAVLDVDRSGQVDVVAAIGSAWDANAGEWMGSELAVLGDAGVELGFSLDNGTMPGAALYLDDPDVTGTEQDRLLADFDGDGFVDQLVLRDHLRDAVAGSPGDPYLSRNARASARHRVTAIHDAAGGEIALAYSTSTLRGDSDDLPWPVEVIESVDGAAGLSTFTFEGGVYWGRERRFLGFRDALVQRELGDSSQLRFVVAPWASGALVSQADRRSDGSLERFSYTSYLEASGGWVEVDGEAPFWNPPRRHCEVHASTPGTLGPPADGEADYALDCDSAGGAQVATAGAMSALLGWDGEEDMGGQHGLHAWSLDDPEVRVPATGGGSGASGDWTVEATYPSTRDYPDLVTGIGPADLPAEPTPPSRDVVATSSVMHGESWTYDAYHRVEWHRDYADASLTGDDVYTEREYEAWDWSAFGSALAMETRYLGGGTFLEAFAYTTAAGSFDLPGTITQWGPTGSRTWTREYTRGDLSMERDPDGVEQSYARDDCGVVTTRTDSAMQQEITTIAGCRPEARAYLGALTAWTYDPMGRVATVTTDGGVATSDIQWTLALREDDADDIADDARPDSAIVHADGTVVLSWLDGWGREVLTRTCAVPGATTASDIDSVACPATGGAGAGIRVVESRRGYAGDGSLRVVTAPYLAWSLSGLTWLAGELPASTWTFADERGRAETILSPVPEAVATADWVTTTRSFGPGWTEEEGPTGRSCRAEHDTLRTEWSCEGYSRGSVERDALGRTVAETDPAGTTWVTSYDGLGRMESRQIEVPVPTEDGPATMRTTWSWTDGGRPYTVTDESGNVTTYAYDSAGRRDTTTYAAADGSGTGIVADEAHGAGTTGTWSSVTDLDGNTAYVYRDGLGRETGRILPDLSVLATTYDDRGRVATTLDWRGGTTTREYTVDGLVASVEGPSGAVTTLEHDGAGRLSSSTDADGVTETVERAYDGSPVQRWAGGYDVESWTYLDDGLVSVHEVAGVATAFEHDALGRATGACTGAALATCWSGGGQEQAWAYDDADRVSRASLRWSASGWRDTTLVRDDLGRVISATHPDGSTEAWGHDRAGHLARHVDEEGVERTWSHDGWGRLSSESVPGLATGIAHAYARAQPGGLARHDVTMPDGATWTTYSAEWAGRVASEIDPLGTTTTREYDGPDLHRVEVEGPAGDALEWGYWHDAAGRLEARAGPVPVGTVASFSTAPDPVADAIHGFRLRLHGGWPPGDAHRPPRRADDVVVVGRPARRRAGGEHGQPLGAEREQLHLRRARAARDALARVATDHLGARRARPGDSGAPRAGQRPAGDQLLRLRRPGHGPRAGARVGRLGGVELLAVHRRPRPGRRRHAARGGFRRCRGRVRARRRRPRRRGDGDRRGRGPGGDAVQSRRLPSRGLDPPRRRPGRRGERARPRRAGVGHLGGRRAFPRGRRARLRRARAGGEPARAARDARHRGAELRLGLGRSPGVALRGRRQRAVRRGRVRLQRRGVASERDLAWPHRLGLGRRLRAGTHLRPRREPPVHGAGRRDRDRAGVRRREPARRHRRGRGRPGSRPRRGTRSEARGRGAELVPPNRQHSEPGGRLEGRGWHLVPNSG